MALLFNNNTPVHILYNNQNVSKVVYNGHDVWLSRIIKTITGVPPLTIPDSSSESLYNYKIYGNLLRDGIPDIDNPVDIQTVGDLVTDPLDEHYGEYKIPVIATVHSLPAEYQEVEYIESNGAQYINTDVVPTNNTKVEAKFFNNGISSWYVFGARGSSTIYFALTGSGAGSTVNANVNGTSTGTGWKRTSDGALYETTIETKTNKYDFHIKDLTNNKEVNKTNISYTPMSVLETPIMIFALKSSNIQNNTTKFYYFRIYENDVLIRDLVPCYRISDDEIGMYDIVNDVFYTNEGSRPFEKGNDILPITTNIYLNEPLRKTELKTDYIDFKNQVVVRGVKEYVFDGSETWAKVSGTGSNPDYMRYKMGETRLYNELSAGEQICNYLPYGTPSSQSILTGASIYSSSGMWFRIRYNDMPTTISGMKAFVKGLADNGNPLRIAYGLRNNTEESIQLPEILTREGINIISVGTSLQPSNMEVQYYAKPE